MFKQLFLTDIQSNRSLLYFFSLVNIGLFVVLGYRGEQLPAFLGGTTISYWVFLIFGASMAGDEKRVRLYCQLPVTTAQMFISGWLFVLGWLCIQVITWIAFGIIFDGSFTVGSIPELFSVALAIAIFSSIISIAIDLKNFSPRYLQLAYIAFLVSIVAINIRSDIAIGLTISIEGYNFYPFAYLESGLVELTALTTSLFALLFVNYLVFTRNDNFLY